jgi:hypothetical protein
MENTDKLKAEFERYITYARRCLSLNYDEGRYLDAEVQQLWETYQKMND